MPKAQSSEARRYVLMKLQQAALTDMWTAQESSGLGPNNKIESVFLLVNLFNISKEPAVGQDSHKIS